jgi:DAACS family dicarboxylate/amino acid:cation (Na+ or H+) symporter
MSASVPHTEGTLTIRILAGMAFGVLVGALFGAEVAPLGVVGKLFIQLIKVLAVPLVFFSILDALITAPLSWRNAQRLFLIVCVNTTCALAIGLGVSNLFRPGRLLKEEFSSFATATPPTVEPLSFAKALTSFVPESIVAPFAENNVIAVVILALLLGSALRQHLSGGKADYETRHVERLTRTILSVWNSVIMLLVKLVPIAVFCVTARTVGEHGFEPFLGLVLYVSLAVMGMALHIILVYPLWIRWVAKIPLKLFIEHAKRPVIYAFGTNSSLATLPITLESLDALKVSKASSRLGACVGTNLNNDGIVLYEAMAALLVAQAFGFELTLGQQILAAGISLIAAVGVAGVPEAGVVSLSLVLSALGLPLEVVPILLTVDWIVARMRSITNVLSDMTVSIAIDGLESRSLRREVSPPTAI